jgi:hypothetical protein
MNKKLLSVLIISLLARIFYFIYSHPIWWDAAVYLSMAKYIFTLGNLGLWEPIRPLLWPLLLGLGFVSNINIIIWAYILTTICSIGIIYLVFEIAKKLYGEKVALLSAILVSLTWILFYFNVRMYTEIPSLFFALLALYFFLKEKPFLVGAFTALAFLTKFPQGIILIVFTLLYIKSFKKLSKLYLPFILITLPYFILNFYLYGSFINNLLLASEVVANAGLWIFQQPWYFYPLELFKQNILYLFAIPGIYFAIKKKHYALLLPLVLFLIYFTQMPHKEIRFAILFIPYLAILASNAYYRYFTETKVFILIILVIFTINFQVDSANENSFFSFLEEDIQGEILVTHPLTAYYLGTDSTPMYFPWFNSEQASFWLNYIQEENPEYITLDTCEGGFLCPPDEETCKTKQEEIFDYLDDNYDLEYYKESGICEYFIYSMT